VEAVAQATKQGYVFLFDRDSGQPLFPIEERPVPASDLKGEAAWPTQPFPTKPPPFARQVLTEDLITDRTPLAREAALAKLRASRTGDPFIPPSAQGTVIFPGYDGGAEWGGQAFDEETGLLYVNANEMAWILQMVEVDRAKESTDAAHGRVLYQQHCAVCHGSQFQGDPQGQYPKLVDLKEKQPRDVVDRLIADGKGVMPSFGMLTPRQRAQLVAYLYGDPPKPIAPGEDPVDLTVPYSHTGYNRFLDVDGYPAIKPPWGTLNAIDLARGEIAWTRTLGELPELTKAGLPPTGTENYGGPIVTAGGLIFIGATKDEKFRAFDKATGALLWETALPAGGYATPSTYSVGGKQYVVIAAGGGKMGTKSGDAYVAFSLP
jgi:quinoprotein glucose dehydrogenase